MIKVKRDHIYPKQSEDEKNTFSSFYYLHQEKILFIMILYGTASYSFVILGNI